MAIINLLALKKALRFNEFDYHALSAALKNYAQIRAKISQLLKTENIIRVKKGLYVLNPKISNSPISQEILANLIYGPSYISLDYALSFYQMIPERVYEISSISFKKSKEFQTPLGLFSYTHLQEKFYSLGITQAPIDSERKILIASKEKALIDTLYFSGIHTFKNLNSTEKSQSKSKSDSIEQWLFEDKRLDPDIILNLDPLLLQYFLNYYRQPAIRALIQWLIKNNKNKILKQDL